MSVHTIPDVVQRLTHREAVALLPDRPYIQTLRDSDDFLLGVEWSRETLVQVLALYPCERSGPAVMAAGLGLTFEDEQGRVFVETKP